MIHTTIQHDLSLNAEANIPSAAITPNSQFVPEMFPNVRWSAEVSLKCDLSNTDALKPEKCGWC